MVPSLRRRLSARASSATDAIVPWALTTLLREGAADLVDRSRTASGPLDVAVVLAPGASEVAVPRGLLEALPTEMVSVRTLPSEQVAAAADADVVLAAGWPAAPEVFTLQGVRARAVLATGEPAPLEHLGWTAGMPVIGPAWMGGTLPPGADPVFAPMPVHRREDLVLIHGEEPLGLLAAAVLHERREDLAFVVTGVRNDVALPFPFLGVPSGAAALAHAFASATVALAPPARGWRPAAVAMLACGQAVVAPADATTRMALGEAAALADSPDAAADAVLALLDDLELRADRVRAGLARVPGGWSATARALAHALEALP